MNLVTHQKFFLSSGNVVYALVVAITDPLNEQKEQIVHWMHYLKSKLRYLEDATIFIIGNKADLATKEQKAQSKRLFASLIDIGYSADWVVISAKKSMSVDKVISNLRKSLQSKSYFAVPRLYKQIGQDMQKSSRIRLGSVLFDLTVRFS